MGNLAPTVAVVVDDNAGASGFVSLLMGGSIIIPCGLGFCVVFRGGGGGGGGGGMVFVVYGERAVPERSKPGRALFVFIVLGRVAVFILLPCCCCCCWGAGGGGAASARRAGGGCCLGPAGASRTGLYIL